MQKKPVTRNADNIIEKQDTNGVDPWNHLDVIVAHNHLKSFGRLWRVKVKSQWCLTIQQTKWRGTLIMSTEKITIEDSEEFKKIASNLIMSEESKDITEDSA